MLVILPASMYFELIFLTWNLKRLKADQRKLLSNNAEWARYFCQKAASLEHVVSTSWLYFYPNRSLSSCLFILHLIYFCAFQTIQWGTYLCNSLYSNKAFPWRPSYLRCISVPLLHYNWSHGKSLSATSQEICLFSKTTIPTQSARMPSATRHHSRRLRTLGRLTRGMIRVHCRYRELRHQQHDSSPTATSVAAKCLEPRQLPSVSIRLFMHLVSRC